MIQTDAAINPATPVVRYSIRAATSLNEYGSGRTLPDGTSAQNIGFAIPDATIESLLKQLEAVERRQSRCFHRSGNYVDDTFTATGVRFTVSSGAVVMSVISGTGAAAAGVKQGDVIVGINKSRSAALRRRQRHLGIASGRRDRVARGARQATPHHQCHPGQPAQELGQRRETAVDGKNGAVI